MELKAAKKVVIITEALIEQQVIRFVTEQGVKAYTVFRNLIGKGARGIRSGECLERFCDNVRIEMVVAEEAEALAVMEAVHSKFLATKYAGIIYLEDVRILPSGKIKE